MNARNRIIYQLVKQAKISHKEAWLALASGQVSLNAKICTDNELVNDYDSLYLGDKCIIDGNRYSYFKFYKPVGIECTLQSSIPHALSNFLGPTYSSLFYLGRLDKNSEGLILLSNDGNIYNKVIQPEKHIEKVYKVAVESPINTHFKEHMEAGVSILGTKTLPCKVILINQNTFEITLTQGLNRQIRRMCFALGNYVVSLKRTAIGEISLLDLKPGEIKPLDQSEIAWLRNLT